jgi:hypothetical protein
VKARETQNSGLRHIGVNTLFHVPGDIGGTEIYLRETLKEMVAGLAAAPLLPVCQPQ